MQAQAQVPLWILGCHRPAFYTLDPVDGLPVEVFHLHDWAAWYEKHDGDRAVAMTEIAPTIWVSTVFLGAALVDRGQRPLLYETRVFGGPWSGWSDRYETREQAEAGHLDVVEMIRRDPRREEPD